MKFNWIPISNLRVLRADWVKALTGPVTICCHSEPVAVLIPFDQYLQMKRELEATK